LVDTDLGIVQQRQTGGNHLGEVVRRNVGGHPHRDPRRAVDQQIGDPGRQHLRNLLGFVIIGHEIDGVLAQVGEQCMSDLRHADFGVAHRRRSVTVDGTKIALPVDQGVAQRKRLRHAHYGVIDRGVSVGMVFTDHIPDHPR